MTLEEAVAAFEADLAVSDAPFGYPTDETVPGRVDPDRAPNGEHYVRVTSGGILDQGEQFPSYYATEALAAEAWLAAAWKYAEERGGKMLHWRVRPEYTAYEFIAINQAALMNDPEWRGSITAKMGRVSSRMLITKADQPQPAKRKATK